MPMWGRAAGRFRIHRKGASLQVTEEKVGKLESVADAARRGVAWGQAERRWMWL